MLRQLERVGVAASVICGIHCLATPLLVVAAPTISTQIGSAPFLEEGLMLVSAISSVVVLGYDTVRGHKQLQPLLIAFFAWLLTLSAHFTTFGQEYHTLISVVGGLLLATAFVRNWQLKRHAHQCASPNCA